MKQSLKEALWILAFSVITFAAVLCIADTARGESLPGAAIEKVKNPDDWLSRKALKWGFAGMFWGAQATSGIVEGYHFGGRRIANSDNYHAYETLRDVEWIGSGYLGYATIASGNLSGWGKARRILGVAMIGRDCKEWGYKVQRYGNPFDYTKERNEHSLVYFGFRNGKITDLYLGTGPATGPLVDMLFLAGGVLLLSWE